MTGRWPRLEVTEADIAEARAEADIAEARANDAVRSPLMLAAQRQFPASDVRVDIHGLTLTHHCVRCCCASIYACSRRARRFLHRFSAGLPVQSARFEFRGPTVQ